MAMFDNTNYKTCKKCGNTFFTETEIYQYELTSGNNLATGDIEEKPTVIGHAVVCFNCGHKEVRHD